jgi:xylulokinase
MSILGLDIGSTNTKGIVFREDGSVLSQASKEYPMIFPRPGWVEINALGMWNKIIDLIKELNSNSSHDPIKALSVSTFGEAFTPIGKDGRILSNMIYPMDSRCIEELNQVVNDFGAGFIYHTTSLNPSYLYSLPKILWIKRNDPDLFRNIDKFLFNEDMLFHVLGLTETRVSYSLAARTMFFDVLKKEWSQEMLSKYDMEEGKFSKPAPSGTVVGEIPYKVAEKLGFEKGVLVVTGGHDQVCAALGAGAIENGSAANGMGTVECIIPVFSDLLINEKMKQYQFCCEPSAIAGLYVTLAYNMTAGSILNWYRSTIGYADEQTSKNEQLDFYTYIFDQLDFNPSPIHAFPYFGASGTPHFCSSSLGSLLGLSIETTNHDIFKALIESLVYEMKYNQELLEETGIKIDNYRAIGKGAKSSYWLQLKANLLGKPIYRMEVEEAGCLATMILAGVAASIYPNYRDAVRQLVKIKEEFYPEGKNINLYMLKYEKYKELYGVLKSILSPK